MLEKIQIASDGLGFKMLPIVPIHSSLPWLIHATMSTQTKKNERNDSGIAATIAEYQHRTGLVMYLYMELTLQIDVAMDAV